MPETTSGNEKTDRLREIFMDVADDTTVTEPQRESHGTLQTDAVVDETLEDIIQEMATEYGLKTSLSTSELAQVVRLFYDGYSDRDIARELGSANRDKTVARARVRLHLFRDSDFESPFALDHLRTLLTEECTVAEIAATLDVGNATVRKYRTLLDAENAADTVDNQYQRRFEAALDESGHDDPIRDSLEDGLDDAIDGSIADN